jgi:hypothetical protein
LNYKLLPTSLTHGELDAAMPSHASIVLKPFVLCSDMEKCKKLEILSVTPPAWSIQINNYFLFFLFFFSNLFGLEFMQKDGNHIKRFLTQKKHQYIPPKKHMKFKMVVAASYQS